MSNQQLIKSAHIFTLGVMLLGAIVFAVKGATTAAGLAQQNTNSNTNTSRNQNSNENGNQNGNANSTTRNSNNSNASGEQTGMTAMSSQDRNFLMDAAMGGLMEVELGRWAAQQGASAAVKEFGRRMVDDHSRANTELMELASSKGMTLPTKMDEKHQNQVSKLSKLTGAEFDNAYSKMMLSDHKKDVSAFEKESTRGGDTDLKGFAAKTLPTLQEHLQMAQALPGNTGSGDMKGNSNSSNSNSSGNSNGNSNRP
jgi:putative membrane protein